MSTWGLALLIWVIAGVTVVGAGLTVIVSVPALYDQGAKLIPLVAAGGFLLAFLPSWIIAKQLRANARG